MNPESVKEEKPALMLSKIEALCLLQVIENLHRIGCHNMVANLHGAIKIEMLGAMFQITQGNNRGVEAKACYMSVEGFKNAYGV